MLQQFAETSDAEDGGGAEALRRMLGRGGMWPQMVWSVPVFSSALAKHLHRKLSEKCATIPIAFDLVLPNGVAVRSVTARMHSALFSEAIAESARL